MSWRVATRAGKDVQEVIDQADWDGFTVERQQTYQAVSEFFTEQEADKFAKRQVELVLAQIKAARPVKPRPLFGSSCG